MAIRRAAGARLGGGVGIQAPRPSDARVAAGITAVAGAGLLALAVRLTAADVPGLAGAIALAGAALVGAGIVLRRGTVVTSGLALSGAGYVASLVGKGLDPAAGIYAGALVAVAELAYWALEPGAAIRIGRAATARRVLLILAIVLVTMVGGTALIAGVSTPVGDDAALGLVGVISIAGILALAVWLMRTLRGSVG